jgi:hypothetical protein
MTNNTTPKTYTLDELFNGKGIKTVIANNQLIKELIDYFVNLKTPRLISVNYETEFDQSTYRMTVGGSMERTYGKDLGKCHSNKGKGKYNTPDFSLAFDQLIKSKEESLTVGIGNHPDYRLKDLYHHVHGKNSSVKVNKKTGEVVLMGVVIKKTVNVKKKDRIPSKSRTTVSEAKKIIQKELMSKIVTLKINPETIHSISFNKNKISIVCDARILEVKKLQKKLKRPLTEAERDDIYSRIS